MGVPRPERRTRNPRAWHSSPLLRKVSATTSPSPTKGSHKIEKAEKPMHQHPDQSPFNPTLCISPADLSLGVTP